MKNFDIPQFYRSSIISRIKQLRKLDDPRKKDFKPTRLDFGPVEFLIARHFGFCYGVENAIEIAYKTIEENPGRRIFLLSEMIHNPFVNEDLISRGINFIMDNYGSHFIGWEEISKEDIVIIPAFGTTIEIENLLAEKGIDTVKYNTTCPFVEKVWNRAELIGRQDFTIIIHGKAKHEETRATFSHAVRHGASVIVRNIEEAKFLSEIIKGSRDGAEFYDYFKGKHSEGFEIDKHLEKIGVVNQTTMLASETQAIADLLRETMIEKYGADRLMEHFADTRDTLCYATNDNQQAVYGLMETASDLAVVIGGYNSSNTSHLVELLEAKFPTYFIAGPEKILHGNSIKHFDIHRKKELITGNFIPQKEKVIIAITSGASCPDSIVDNVLAKLLSLFENVKGLEEALAQDEKNARSGN